MIPIFKKIIRSGLVAYRHSKLQAQDIMIASYPKSGNTWMRYLLATLITGKNIRSIGDYIPTIENLAPSASYLIHNHGRFIKTHEPFSPSYQNSIYIIRDVRDVTISYYHYLQNVGRHFDDFDKFLEKFFSCKLNNYGCWNEHVESWLTASYKNNIVILRYEDLLADPHERVLSIINHFGLENFVVNLDFAIESCSFNQMKSREQSNELLLANNREIKNFFRSGNKGQWKEFLSHGQKEMINHYYGHLLKELGYEY